jgi:hypothetical protein
MYLLRCSRHGDLTIREGITGSSCNGSTGCRGLQVWINYAKVETIAKGDGVDEADQGTKGLVI